MLVLVSLLLIRSGFYVMGQGSFDEKIVREDILGLLGAFRVNWALCTDYTPFTRIWEMLLRVSMGSSDMYTINLD